MHPIATTEKRTGLPAIMVLSTSQFVWRTNLPAEAAESHRRQQETASLSTEKPHYKQRMLDYHSVQAATLQKEW